MSNTPTAAAAAAVSLPESSSSYVFKATALQGVRNLFPRHINPFYAAFGASQSDVMAYTRCEIPEGRVYMVQMGSAEGTATAATVSTVNHINHKLSLLELQQEQLHTRFPKVVEVTARSAVDAPSLLKSKCDDHFQHNNYWRLPVAIIE